MIGILGAMREETTDILSLMESQKKSRHAGREFHIGKIADKSAVVAFSRWGKVAAATTAAVLIRRFNVSAVLFAGVAGAIHPELKIGDIVVSDNLYQHDMNAEPLFPRHEIPLTGMTLFPADRKLVASAKLACDTLLADIRHHVSEVGLRKFGVTDPKCRVGTIATGDQFVASREQKKLIRQHRPETLAVEMEGAAVAQVCRDHDVPFVAIRTISDLAEVSANIDFSAFVKEIGGIYTKNIIAEMIKTV